MKPGDYELDGVLWCAFIKEYFCCDEYFRVDLDWDGEGCIINLRDLDTDRLLYRVSTETRDESLAKLEEVIIAILDQSNEGDFYYHGYIAECFGEEREDDLFGGVIKKIEDGKIIELDPSLSIENATYEEYICALHELVDEVERIRVI